MPELPEVEVTRLSFAAQIAGARVTEVRVGKPLRWPLFIEPSALVGRTVVNVRRRGKYLLLDLDVKQTDQAGEDGNIDAKAAAIEEVDALLPRLLALAPDVFEG